ncbi:hypothetical protein PISMIDRAFT_200907 [Pisolithus microcarpus 441]|uniref:Uncharacterized protein n=1 Tax=Pisolithus microcarpus 441 TaxID=765257 RepID=A0A0C9YQ40_9AGAM|nr:hypothetical protein PISMIDRAFT_200907 [Pisolithus microcarpus 441]
MGPNDSGARFHDYKFGHRPACSAAVFLEAKFSFRSVAQQMNRQERSDKHCPRLAEHSSLNFGTATESRLKHQESAVNAKPTAQATSWERL